MLAVALDAEERRRYWEYLLAGGEKKKWKWSSPDKAGTTRSSQSKGLAKFAAFLAGGKLIPKGDPSELARATGREVVYRRPDEVVVDETGQPVEVDHDKMIVVPLVYHKPESIH